MVCIKRCCRQWSIPCPSQPACSHQLWKRFPCVPCRLVVARKLSSTGSIDLSTVVPKSVDRTCRQIFCCLTSKQNCEGCHASSFLPTVVPKTANDLSAAFPPEISRTWCRRSTSSFMATSGSALQFEPLAHRSIRAIREKKKETQAGYAVGDVPITERLRVGPAPECSCTAWTVPMESATNRTARRCRPPPI